MSLIKKSNELVIPTTVKMMIYGQAGMGKSTVALSAPKPLLLDFDNGVKRMNMAHLENIDTVQVTSWSDVQQVLQEDLSAYQTIVWTSSLLTSVEPASRPSVIGAVSMPNFHG